MYLSSVEIQNFRSLKTLHADFQPGLNVLVGRNNTGKTSLFQAIRHAIGPSGARGDALWLDRDDFYRESPTDMTERTISVVLSFSDLSKEQRAYFYEIVDFNLADLTKSKAIIRFEASWPNDKRQALIRRTGGAQMADPPEVPSNLLAYLPITFLPALRDAEASLAPGQRSRLALLLRDLAKRKGGNTQEEIKGIFSSANEKLESHKMVEGVTNSLQATTKDLAGSDYSPSAIKAADVDFERILRTLQVQMDGMPIGSLDANGLGYNNLLFMAVVLEHLKTSDPDEAPLLLVEEPEAHLHPQLTILLADYLAIKTPGSSAPQTIVTTHSPTLAASVKPKQVHVLFTDPQRKVAMCHSIVKSGMSDPEELELQRMMDITRATLYFAKAAILVEGISESLLLPILARQMGHDLNKLHISVIPICGVAFGTFRKLLNSFVLGTPVSIVTDGDPSVTRGANWEMDNPDSTLGVFDVSPRTMCLKEQFKGVDNVRVYHSQVTLEYDLAVAGDNNAAIMAEVWEGCFQGTPSTFNRKKVADAGTSRAEKALCAWRGICRASHTGSKAEFAHRLAARLGNHSIGGQSAVSFEIPAYIKDAISFVAERASPPQIAKAAPSPEPSHTFPILEPV